MKNIFEIFRNLRDAAYETNEGSLHKFTYYYFVSYEYVYRIISDR